MFAVAGNVTYVVLNNYTRRAAVQFPPNRSWMTQCPAVSGRFLSESHRETMRQLGVRGQSLVIGQEIGIAGDRRLFTRFQLQIFDAQRNALDVKTDAADVKMIVGKGEQDVAVQ